MNKIRILFFATLRERAGMKLLELEVPPGMTVHALKEKLAGDFPDLRESMGTVLVSINKEFSLDEAVIPPQAEVALFPPVSGGAS
jgi:molybdopterin synthase catalytic subunit